MKYAAIFFSGIGNDIVCDIIEAKDLDDAFFKADDMKSLSEAVMCFPMTSGNRERLQELVN